VSPGKGDDASVTITYPSNDDTLERQSVIAKLQAENAALLLRRRVDALHANALREVLRDYLKMYRVGGKLSIDTERWRLQRELEDRARALLDNS
jgi:hypothetical protein